jgi:hypothetical protein
MELASLVIKLFQQSGVIACFQMDPLLSLVIWLTRIKSA